MGSRKSFDKVEKRSKRRSSDKSSSSSSDSDSSLGSLDEETKKKLLKKLKKLKRKEKKKRRKKQEKDKKKKREKNITECSSKKDLGGDNNSETGNSRNFVPMTKEQWEKQQNTLRRVYDEETGRMRLIKGTGEIVEECVSKERQLAINKQATLKDGEYFQKVLSMKHK